MLTMVGPPGFEPRIAAVGDILAKSDFGSSSSQNLNIKLLIVIVRVEYGGLYSWRELFSKT